MTDSDRRTIPVVVSPDALPSPTITAPGRDLIFGGGNPRIAFAVEATDDFGLRALSLHFTRVSGSGEQFDFEDGEIPLTITRKGAREWTGIAKRSIAELKLNEGDVLVYRAVATDTRPGGGRASSDALFIEISKLGVAAGDAFTLPEQETRYALSQQMLVVKTERLNRQRLSMSPNELTEAAMNLAVEQRMIRAEFVFMLGGEVEDEEVEAEQSNELQEGRLQNRGQRDLRAATGAMSQAEQHLAGLNLAEALIAERAAVGALQRAFARHRYILRALASRTNLDATRRLTGDPTGAAAWRRLPSAAPANRRAAQLQDLLVGIAELSSSADLLRFRSRSRVLAEQALRIDPASSGLREAAVALQRAGDAADDRTRRDALSEAGAATVSETRRSQAEAPLSIFGSGGSLVGSLAEVSKPPRHGTRPR